MSTRSRISVGERDRALGTGERVDRERSARCRAREQARRSGRRLELLRFGSLR